MKDVVSNVQKDFEENGIDLTVLQELEKVPESLYDFLSKACPRALYSFQGFHFLFFFLLA